MEKIYNLVATVGEYQVQGQTKKRYQKVGAVFAETGDDGDTRRAVKLDNVPISAEWDGWLACYPPDSDQAAQPAANKYQQQPAEQPPRQGGW